MNLADVQLLVDYNYWARDRVLEPVLALSSEAYTREIVSSFRSIRDTLVHVYSAEWIWYERWIGISPTSAVPFDRFPDAASLRAAWGDLEREIRMLVGGLDEAGLERVHEYRLMNDQPGRSVFWQMVQHVVNHGSYHRGQVTTMLRQVGATPPKSLDLITFYRQRQA